jgi:hypothetical protein
LAGKAGEWKWKAVRGRCEMQSEGVAMLVLWRIAERGKRFEVSLELLLVHGMGHLKRGTGPELLWIEE